jgi:hypothetical protein
VEVIGDVDGHGPVLTLRKGEVRDIPLPPYEFASSSQKNRLSP